MRKEEIAALCELALLELPPERQELLAQGIEQMVEYFQILTEFQSEDDSADQRQPSSTRLREDIPAQPFPIEILVEYAPAERRNFFLVPNVL